MLRVILSSGRTTGGSMDKLDYYLEGVGRTGQTGVAALFAGGIILIFCAPLALAVLKLFSR